jgi:transcriptional regulator with PAS, ATPase and Fis domain
MFEFRRRLWKSVFTDDIRWYERHLWNRMEDFSTLLLGETGSGKGTAASAIGRSGFIPYVPERGEFAESFNRTFVSINLAEFPETLIEAELFGYRKGAFTGAVVAHDGVFARCSPHGAIFLDEVGEIRKDIQVKLLHVLQERRFSPVGSRDQLQFRGRVISATNRNLDELRAEKIFRDDFYYRISSDVIPVPSLRQRLAEDPAELDLLLETILERTAGEHWAELLPTVRERLQKSPGHQYDWPGNVRELEQAVRRVLLHGSYEPGKPKGNADEFESIRQAELSADELLGRYCRHGVRLFGTRAEAARRLGLDVRTLQKYIDLQTRTP